MIMLNTWQLKYIIKFLVLFAFLFYGTEAIIGLSAPGGAYNAFVARHLNFFDPFRRFQLLAVKYAVSGLGYQTYFRDAFWVSFVGGRGVRMAYDCIGYGLLSFWIAFVFANKGTWKKKAAWILAGCMTLVAINIIRISLLLVAINKGWPIPFGWDHHTWFNIATYILIFLFIYLFDKSGKESQTAQQKNKKATVDMESKNQGEKTMYQK